MVVAPIIVAEVFQSPRLDYRLVAAGAVTPALLSFVSFGRVTHSLVFWLLILSAVMLATIGQRLLRRRLLGIPIGGLLHLVLDGVWSYDETLLWPILGADLDLLVSPEVERASTMFLLEFLAVGLALWAARRYGLDSQEGRTSFWATGQLPRLR